MNKISSALLLAVVASGIGYWLGTKGTNNPVAAPATQVASTTDAVKKEPKILFYRNPMGMPDTSPVPKKDEMGMDYIPVYEGKEETGPETANQVNISPEKIQKLGVRTEAASLRDLARSIHAVGRIEINEQLTHTIAPRFEGWIEKLFVNTTGQTVVKGQPLFNVYSPELALTKQEYAIARWGRHAMQNANADAQVSMKKLAESSVTRMRNWDISEDQLQSMRDGDTLRALSYISPVNGVVIEKKAVQGMRFAPGDVLYQIADLSSVWIIADVFEQDLALIKPGQKARVKINAYPGKEFTAKVVYIYPTLNAQTRSVPVRLELANPGGLLKPAMYADVELAAASKGKVLTVPASAVLHGGSRETVLVELAEGRFEPREVKLGVQGTDFIEIQQGLGEGEKVVVTANFLIDSESNLKAAFSGMGSSQAKPVASTAEHKPGENH